MNLRPQQQEATHQVNTLLNASRHPLYVSPTGTGKTVTAIEIIKHRVKLNQKVWVLTPQEEIFNQWMSGCSEAGLNPGYINSEGYKGLNRNLYICMPQSLLNIIDKLPESAAPDNIFTDECHHSAAFTYDQIYDKYSNATRCGLTATPYRLDNKPLGNYYTDIVETINMQEAIDNNYLAKPLLIVPDEYNQIAKVPIKNGEYDPVKQAEILGEPKIIGDMIKAYSLIFNGLPVLIACATYEHAKLISESFKDYGYNFKHIHSKLPTNERRRMIREIKTGKINGLCTVGIGIEGLDIPGLFGLIWLRRTMSLTIYMQLNGRVLRPLPGKEYGIIIDPVGNTFIHGRPEMDREWSLSEKYSIDETEGPTTRICPLCGVANSLINQFCWICQTDLTAENDKLKKKRNFPAMIDGKLIVLEDIKEKELIQNRLNEQIKVNEKILAEEKEEAQIIISNDEKLSILGNSLTGKNSRGIFKETLKGFI